MYSTGKLGHVERALDRGKLQGLADDDGRRTLRRRKWSKRVRAPCSQAGYSSACRGPTARLSRAAARPSTRRDQRATSCAVPKLAYGRPVVFRRLRSCGCLHMRPLMTCEASAASSPARQGAPPLVHRLRAHPQHSRDTRRVKPQTFNPRKRCGKRADNAIGMDGLCHNAGELKLITVSKTWPADRNVAPEPGDPMNIMSPILCTGVRPCPDIGSLWPRECSSCHAEQDGQSNPDTRRPGSGPRS